MKNKIPYVIILAAILILAAVYGVTTYLRGNPGQNAVISPTGETKSFEVTARQFVFAPDQISVNRGDNVKLRLTSQDVVHGFRLDEFGINETLNAGETVEIEFIADKIGSFEFRCSVPCGEGHSEMTGSLVVK